MSLVDGRCVHEWKALAEYRQSTRLCGTELKHTMYARKKAETFSKLKSTFVMRRAQNTIVNDRKRRLACGVCTQPFFFPSPLQRAEKKDQPTAPLFEQLYVYDQALALWHDSYRCQRSLKHWQQCRMKLICEHWIRIKRQALSREEALNRFVTCKSKIELGKAFQGWCSIVKVKGVLRYDQRKRKRLDFLSSSE